MRESESLGLSLLGLTAPGHPPLVGRRTLRKNLPGAQWERYARRTAARGCPPTAQYCHHRRQRANANGSSYGTRLSDGGGTRLSFSKVGEVGVRATRRPGCQSIR
jgi:hypothetical protein